jgi:murein DD-endopeptidase MepM/ murein hydrolase activator NlpD
MTDRTLFAALLVLFVAVLLGGIGVIPDASSALPVADATPPASTESASTESASTESASTESASTEAAATEAAATEAAATESASDEADEDGTRARRAADPKEASRVDRFGIRFKQYDVSTGTVQRYQTFADLLEKHGVSYQRIVTLARESRDVYDVRDIQAGKSYRIYSNPWLQRARYLVYRPTRTDYVVFDVRHPERSHTGERPVSVSWKTAAGTINSSLYETLLDSGASPELVLDLSEVFAWQIDFFRIRRGDSFRVVYEERSVDGTTVAPGEIVAAMFRHRGETYYAFRFNEGSGSEYFDEEGNSVRRQLLKAPLRFSRISSRFTNRRYHPVLKRYRPHHGTDYAAPRGTPVHSVGDGEVLYAGRKGYNGNYVKIRHNATYTTGYLHLARVKVRPGETVKQGEVIGTVGSTGLSTGPHLDYRFWKNGKARDPYSIELPPARPVSPQNQDAYQEVVDRLMDRLHAPALVSLGPRS